LPNPYKKPQPIAAATRGGRAGVAVLADMLLTTHLMTLVLLTVWKKPLWVCALFYLAFAPIEATFWSSTLTKVPYGAAALECPALTLRVVQARGS